MIDGNAHCWWCDLQVLAPLMGWVRNYHGYQFFDRKDGAAWGPEDSNAIDLMHMSMNGFAYLDDRKTRLAEILQVAFLPNPPPRFSPPIFPPSHSPPPLPSLPLPAPSYNFTSFSAQTPVTLCANLFTFSQSLNSSLRREIWFVSMT